MYIMPRPVGISHTETLSFESAKVSEFVARMRNQHFPPPLEKHHARTLRSFAAFVLMYFIPSRYIRGVQYICRYIPRTGVVH